MRSRLLVLLTAALAACGYACARSDVAVAARAQSAAPSQAPATPSAPAASEPSGQDFSAELRLLSRIVACSGTDPVPAGLEAVVEEHCRALLPMMDRHHRRYVDAAQPFLAGLQPQGLPTRLVYPFGGGDLLSALTTFGNATEITTLSLEHAGDPRRIKSAEAAKLEVDLGRLRRGISGLLALSDSTSENLMQLQRGDLPGQLSFFLIGLAIHEQEPVGLRFFRLREDGTPEYLSEKDIAALEDKTAGKLNQVWKSPDFSVAFSNAEMTFRPRAGGPLRVHRHIAANLSNDPLTKDPRVLRYLEKQGRVVAMTKAASFILWAPGFSKIRSYLLSNMEFMVSDATGIPPEFAKKAGFVQETYGSFSGPFLEASMRHAEDFCALWEEQPKRPLPFRYGYPDVLRANHLVVTRRPAAQP
jgi:hypothetical protein